MLVPNLGDSLGERIQGTLAAELHPSSIGHGFLLPVGSSESTGFSPFPSGHEPLVLVPSLGVSILDTPPAGLYPSPSGHTWGTGDSSSWPTEHPGKVPYMQTSPKFVDPGCRILSYLGTVQLFVPHPAIVYALCPYATAAAFQDWLSPPIPSSLWASHLPPSSPLPGPYAKLYVASADPLPLHTIERAFAADYDPNQDLQQYRHHAILASALHKKLLAIPRTQWSPGPMGRYIVDKMNVGKAILTKPGDHHQNLTFTPHLTGKLSAIPLPAFPPLVKLCSIRRSTGITDSEPSLRNLVHKAFEAYPDLTITIVNILRRGPSTNPDRWEVWVKLFPEVTAYHFYLTYADPAKGFGIFPVNTSPNSHTLGVPLVLPLVEYPSKNLLPEFSVEGRLSYSGFPQSNLGMSASLGAMIKHLSEHLPPAHLLMRLLEHHKIITKKGSNSVQVVFSSPVAAKFVRDNMGIKVVAGECSWQLDLSGEPHIPDHLKYALISAPTQPTTNSVAARALNKLDYLQQLTLHVLARAEHTAKDRRGEVDRPFSPYLRSVTSGKILHPLTPDNAPEAWATASGVPIIKLTMADFDHYVRKAEAPQFLINCADFLTAAFVMLSAWEGKNAMTFAEVPWTFHMSMFNNLGPVPRGFTKAACVSGMMALALDKPLTTAAGIVRGMDGKARGDVLLATQPRPVDMVPDQLWVNAPTEEDAEEDPLMLAFEEEDILMEDQDEFQDYCPTEKRARTEVLCLIPLSSLVSSVEINICLNGPPCRSLAQAPLSTHPMEKTRSSPCRLPTKVCHYLPSCSHVFQCVFLYPDRYVSHLVALTTLSMCNQDSCLGSCNILTPQLSFDIVPIIPYPNRPSQYKTTRGNHCLRGGTPPSQTHTGIYETTHCTLISPECIGFYAEAQSQGHCGLHALCALANRPLADPSSFYNSLKNTWPEGRGDHYQESGWYTHIALNHWLHDHYHAQVTLILTAYNVVSSDKRNILGLCPQHTTSFLLLSNEHYTCWKQDLTTGIWYEIDSVLFGQTGKIRRIRNTDWLHIRGCIFTTVSLDPYLTGHTGYTLSDDNRIHAGEPHTLHFLELATALARPDCHNPRLNITQLPEPNLLLDKTTLQHYEKPNVHDVHHTEHHANTHLIVATLNVRGYHSTLNYLRSGVPGLLPPHIWIFTETRLIAKKSESINTAYCMPTYTQLHSPTPNMHTGGVTIAIANNLYNMTCVTQLAPPTHLRGNICHVSLTYPDKVVVHLLGVYISPANTPHNLSTCEHIYNYLTTITIQAKANNQWVLIGGDFNGTLYPEDRTSLSPPNNRDNMLRTFYNNMDMCDLTENVITPWTYTYESPDSRIKSKIDRIICTTRQSLPFMPHHATIHRLPDSPTDHNVLSVSIPYTSANILPMPALPAHLPKTKIATPITPKNKNRLSQVLKQEFDLRSQRHAAHLKTCYETDVKHFLAELEKTQSPGTSRLTLTNIKGQPAKPWIDSMGKEISDILVQAMEIAKEVCPQSCTNPLGLSHRPRSVQRHRKLLMQQKYVVLTKMGSTIQSPETLASRIHLNRQLRQLKSTIQSIDRKHHSYNKQLFLRQQQHLMDKRQSQGNKKLTGKYKPRNELELIIVRKQNGDITTDPHDISNYITEYFTDKMRPPSPKEEILNYDSALRDCPWEDPKNPDYYHISTKVSPHRRVRVDNLINDLVEFRHCLKHLPQNKAPGPDLVINEVIQAMPDSFHDTLFYLFQIMWAAARTPTDWKLSYTKLIDKHKGSFLDIDNYRRLGLECTIYKLWTSFITRALNKYAEDNAIFSKGQLGFRRKQKTSKQIETLCSLIEHAKFHHKDIFLMLLDCTEAFDTVDHAKLTRIMFKLGFPTDAINVIGDLYTDAATMLRTPHNLCTTIPVDRGTLQGDSLSPLLFIIYIEPLLRWLFCGQRGYTFHSHNNDTTTISDISWADDINIPTETLEDLHIQASKITLFCDWAHLKVSHVKTCVTGALHKTSPQHPYHTQQLKRRLHNRIIVQGLPTQFKSPHDSFKFLGIHINMKLDWSHHYHCVYTDIKESVTHILQSYGNPYQKRRVVENCLRERLSYSFIPMPFNPVQLQKLDNLLTQVYKQSYGLSKCCSNALAHQDNNLGGLGCQSLRVHYIMSAVQSLTRALSDTGDLGMLTHSLLQHQLHLYLNQPQLRHLLCASALRLRQLQAANEAGIDISNQLSPTNYSFPTNVHTLNSLVNDFITNSRNTNEYPSKFIKAVRTLCDLPIVNLDVMFDQQRHCTLCASTVQHTLNVGHNFRRKHARAINIISIYLNDPDKTNQGLLHLTTEDLPTCLRTIHGEHPGVTNFIHSLTSPPPSSNEPFASLPIHFVSPAPRRPSSHRNKRKRDGVATLDPFSTSFTKQQHKANFNPEDWRMYQTGADVHTPARQTPTIGEIVRQLLHVHPKPINPHADIRPTGQITLLEQHMHLYLHHQISQTRVGCLYNHDGTLAGTFELDTMKALWKRFCDANASPSQRHNMFLNSLLKLLTCYHYTPKLTINEKSICSWRTPNQIYSILVHYFHVNKERFASPLNSCTQIPYYWTPNKSDSAFGALYDAYTCRWTGYSVANPEYTHFEMYKAVKWAIASSQMTSDSTYTIFVLPAWDHPRLTTYNALVSNYPSNAQTWLRLPGRYFAFIAPDSWNGIKTKGTHQPKWDVNFLVVGNAPGIQKFNTILTTKRVDITNAFCCALRTLTHKTLHPSLVRYWFKPIDITRPPTVSPCLATKRLKNLPVDDTLLPVFNKCPDIPLPYSTSGAQLRWNWCEFIYTDGAVLTDPPSGSRGLGAGVFLPSSHSPHFACGQQFFVPVSSQGHTGTINRCELAAIYVALRLGSTNIATDSLCAIYQIRQFSRTPDDFTEHRHHFLLQEIVRLIVTNNKPVYLYKVVSHTGVIGNEIADSIATQVAMSPVDVTPEYFYRHDIPQSNTRTSLYWPYITNTSDNNDRVNTTLVPVANLTSDLKSYLTTLYKLGFADVNSNYFRRWNELNTKIDTFASHYFLCHPRVTTWNTARLILKCRTGQLWTEKMAVRCKISQSPTCPLCGHLDSVGHILGSCTKLKGLYIQRHHKLCQSILRGILDSDIGASLIQADVGRGTESFLRCMNLPRYLPASYTGTVNPPSIPDFTLYIPFSTTVPELHVVEIKTCQDTDPSQQLEKAKQQHLHLVRLVQQRNPHIQVYLHIILIGQMGSIYNEYTLQPLHQLGIKDNALRKLTKQLHLISVHSLATIVRSRRRLEHAVSSLRTYLTKRKSTLRSPHSQPKFTDPSPTRKTPDSRKIRRLTFDSTPRRCRHSSGVT